MQRSVVAALAAVVLLVGLSGCSKKKGIESLEPGHGSIAGSDDVIIKGHGFAPGMTVHFGKRPVKKLVIQSESQIQVKTPSGPEGMVDVIVTDDTGQSYVLKNGFKYVRQGS